MSQKDPQRDEMIKQIVDRINALSVEDLQRAARSALLSKMEEISERCWCAGWMDGLEFQLWDAIVGGTSDYGMDLVTEDDVQTLIFLASHTGEWPTWGAGTPDRVWLEFAEWVPKYLAYKESQRNLGTAEGV